MVMRDERRRRPPPLALYSRIGGRQRC
eukprot:SAG31_NODE_12872_length_909_cov_0.965475_1_plen_26_part_01